MNTPANTMPESPHQPQAVAPAVISPAWLFYWSVRRELWENRAIYIAPLVVAVLFVFGFLINTIHQRLTLTPAWNSDPKKFHGVLTTSYEGAAALIMGTAFILGIFYSLDALYGERRDRSILFWKSLPVSDLTAVLSKLTVPIVILPLLSFAMAIVTQLVMLLLSTIVFLGSGVSIAALWTHVSFFHESLMLLYHIVTIHGVWYAPIYGWLLLVSAWARRAPFLWAFLPPFAIFGVEKIAFNTRYFLDMLAYRLTGPEPMTPVTPGGGPMNVLTAVGPWQFFTTPGLWVGLAVAAVFLAAAVRLRRYRGPV
jgi:ABC-2 type transport system permease protein